MKKLKGYIPKKEEPKQDRTAAESLLGVVALFNDLKDTKAGLVKTVNDKVSEVEDIIEEAKQTTIASAKKVDEIVAEFEETAITLMEDIHNLPHIKGAPGKNGKPGKDANESAIVKKTLALVPKVDIEKLTQSVLKHLPENKASLKVIRETFTIDPIVVAKEIMRLPTDVFTFKMSQVDGLESAIRLLQHNSASKSGYIHGGGFNNIYNAGTLVSNGLTGLNFAGAGVSSVTKNATTGIITVTISGGGSSITLQTNGVANGSQSLLNLKQGTNITLTDDGVGGITIDASGGGSQTLAQTLAIGNVTGGTSIVMSAGDYITSVNAQTQIEISNNGLIVTTDAGSFGTPYMTLTPTQIELAGLGGGGILFTLGSLSIAHNTLIDFTTATPVRFSGLTASRITATDGSKNLVTLDTATYPSLTELAFVKGTTSAIQTQLNARELLTNKATDFVTLNNTLYPTTQAVADYVANAVVGLLDYRGSYDASTNLFPATGGSGVLGAVLKGDFWICSVGGTLGGVAVTPGDLIIALVDTPGQTSTNWDLVAHNLGSYVTSITGTANQIIASGATGAVTLSLPQNINTGANVVFNQVTAALVGNASTATALQNARTIGGVSFDGTANITVATATGGFTVSGGNLALGTNSITLTGSIATTGARATKIWTADLESTNMPTVGGTSLTTVAQTLQNKTITNSNNVLGGVTMTLGSDADGDMYYRASNVLTRLAKGTALQELRMNAGATAPEWFTPSSAGDVYAMTSKPTTYWNFTIPMYARGDITVTDDSASAWDFANANVASKFLGSWALVQSDGNCVLNTANSGGYTGIPATTGGGSSHTFALNKKMVVSFRIYGDTLTSSNTCFGLAAGTGNAFYTPNATASVGRVMFTYDGTTFRTLTDDGANITVNTVAITITNWNNLRIEFDPASEARFYLNGTLVATHTSGQNLPSSGNVLFGSGTSGSGKVYGITTPIISVEL